LICFFDIYELLGPNEWAMQKKSISTMDPNQVLPSLAANRAARLSWNNERVGEGYGVAMGS
jgi:hypothetical protein